MGIEYLNQDLFDVPEGSILVHAVNAQGVWGSGIAAEFKKRFPYAFEQYNKYCQHFNKTGNGIIIKGSFTDWNEPVTNVGCLFTSNKYGKDKDDKETIKVQTATALKEIIKYGNVFYSNKFNSGLFGVPWEETEFILKTVLKQAPGTTWYVCDKQK